MAVKRMYFLDCGVLTVDRSSITYKHGMGEQVDIPVIPVLIDTDDGYVLFDTGLDPDGLSTPEETWGFKRKVVKSFTEENDIRNQLKKIDVNPEDIKYVVNSHFHWDHTGGNRHFNQSTIYVQKSEYRFAYFPDSFASSTYIKHQFDHELNYELIEGDTEVVYGVYITTSSGHTPGHQSLIVHLPNECAVLVGDAVYSKENIEKDIAPGNTWSLPYSVESLNKLKHITKRSKGSLYITHDPEFWDDHNSLPYYYE